MKLTIFPYQPATVLPGKATVIGTQSHRIYLSLLNGLLGRNQTVKLANEDYEPCEINQGIFWLGDIFVNDHLDSIFQRAINQKLMDNLSDVNRDQIAALDYQIYQRFLDTSFLMETPLTAKYEFNPDRMLKAYRFNIDLEHIERAYDMIEVLLRACFELKITKMITICNLSDYLTDDELAATLATVKLLQLNVLLIEYSETKKTAKYEKARYYYIDDDLVEWRYDS